MAHQLFSACVGVWLMVAPWALGYGGVAADADRVVGPLIASFALVACWEVARGLRWLNVGLGSWLLVAPLLFGYGTAPTINSLLAGAVVALLSSRGGGRPKRATGGGFRALFSAQRS